MFACRGSTLAGVIHRPSAGRSNVAVLIIVGGPQYRVGSHRQFVHSARALARAGYPVLRFDYRGMGDSEGEYAGFESITEDIRAAIDAVELACSPRHGVVLLGLCDAASAALIYCCSDPRVAGLILMNPWVRSEQSQAAAVVRHYYVKRLFQVDFWRKLAGGGVDFVGSIASLFGNVARAARRPRMSEARGFIDAMRLGLQRFTGPVLIVQSGRDLTAEEFRTLCSRDEVWHEAILRESITVVNMAEADHTFSRELHLDQFNNDCGRWLSRTFGDEPCR